MFGNWALCQQQTQAPRHPITPGRLRTFCCQYRKPRLHRHAGASGDPV